MAFSPDLGNTVTNTKMRTPGDISPFSGMCTVCSMNCTGMCEIGLSALRGREAIYPFQTDRNQFASEKDYPIDYSHLNINGRVFGAWGRDEDPLEITFPKADLETEVGIENPVKLKLPIILPAMAKLNWRDYYGGAALAGVLVVIGEDVVMKDPDLELVEGKVVKAPLIGEMLNAFRKYHRGYGDIVLQGNYDDEHLGVLDYAIKELGATTVELKFAQAAKGIQGLGIVKTYEEALKLSKMGYIINPDPQDPKVKEDWDNGKGPLFEKIGKLPVWSEEHLVKRVAELKEAGAKRVFFKTGPFSPQDLAKILMIASKAGVDLVTFDGAGGGTGNSPVKMMNEWGIPTITLESILFNMLDKMKERGLKLPRVAITGGIAMEDQVFKALALGAPHINIVGIGRAAMAAAMAGKKVEELLNEGIVPKEYQRFGSTKEELFEDIRHLKLYYDEPEKISGGAIGLFSYLERIKSGVQQLMALNRKFSIGDINREDVVPLTDIAKKVTGLKDFMDMSEEALDSLK
ncbi:MAG: glutamate synthase-related protein [Gudongella sp.]|jgi:hypothetical protein|nr:glutamate synthase-related protein [Gudongella sp.]